MQDTIINFKGTAILKQAIRIAAATNGNANSSEFIKEILGQNSMVCAEVKKLSKKVKIN